MQIYSSATAFRIYLSFADKDRKEMMHASILFKAKEAGLTGGTGTEGEFGYGAQLPFFTCNKSERYIENTGRPKFRIVYCLSEI